jgi:hypothetical protein
MSFSKTIEQRYRIIATSFRPTFAADEKTAPGMTKGGYASPGPGERGVSKGGRLSTAQGKAGYLIR